MLLCLLRSIIITGIATFNRTKKLRQTSAIKLNFKHEKSRCDTTNFNKTKFNMKRLRNIAIYYIILGILLMLSFWFFKLWKLSIIGVLLLIIYFILRYLFGVKTIPNNLSKSKLLFFDLFFYVHPILIVALIWWYTAKPFKQIILLPQGYTGIVVIDYDRKDGQEKKWMNSFLGIGGSRLIKIDTNGYAKTQFKHFNQSIPILEIENDTDDWEGTKLYYENNLYNEIAFFTREKDHGSDDLFKKITKHNLPIAYSYLNSDEELVFIIGIGNDYHKYFYNKGNMENDSDYYLQFSDSLRMEYKEQIKKLINK